MHPFLFARPRAPVVQRGFSMLEALVGLLMLSGGMLGLSRLQTDLRANADLARERSVAVRLAQTEIERLRGFAGLAAWEAIVDEPSIDVTPPAGTTRYTLQRLVQTHTDPAVKAVQITLQWTDRHGAARQLRLDSLIGGHDPALSGAVTLPHARIGQS